MSEDINKLPLFPLSGHVLPGGTMRLRIFEPRYLRMVKEVAAAGDQGKIGMCMFNEKGVIEDNTHIYPIITVSKIVDFEHREDGLLGITVQGESLAKLQNIDVDKDGLRYGYVEPSSEWPATQLDQTHSHLAERLCDVYKHYPELGQCPQGEPLERADWVCKRWLEILPLNPEVKQSLLEQPTCDSTLDYLVELIDESEK